MKKTTALVALLTVISAVAFATDNKEKELDNTTKYKLVKASDFKYDLYYVSENEGNVSIKIFSPEGKMLTNDKLKHIESFKRRYNFRELAPGNYRVVIENANGKATESIFHNPDRSALKSMVTRIPDAKSVKVLVGAFDNSKPVNIKIYDDQYRLLYHDKITNSESFSKVYNLIKVESENIVVNIENNRESTTVVRSLNN